jgi:hypothetical protein
MLQLSGKKAEKLRSSVRNREMIQLSGKHVNLLCHSNETVGFTV